MSLSSQDHTHTPTYRINVECFGKLMGSSNRSNSELVEIVRDYPHSLHLLKYDGMWYTG